MTEYLNIRKPSDFSEYHGVVDRHPLVSVIEYEGISPIKPSVNRYDVYGIFLHTSLNVALCYGCGRYDYKDGMMICVAPGQVGGAEGSDMVDIDGWSILFHPDMLHGTALEKSIADYTFFDYQINEALYLTSQEQATLTGIIRHIKAELEYPHDDMQDKIIVNLIETLLNYTRRFYSRQFTTRRFDNAGILSRLEQLIRGYYRDGLHEKQGLPSVACCAEMLNMSPNYLGDVIKKATGENTSAYIRRFVIQHAKNLLASGKSVSEVAYSLGFEYPQHFTRLFKKETGMTPRDFAGRRSNR